MAGLRLMGRKPILPDDATKVRFVIAWNGGVEIEHMCERFNMDRQIVIGTIKRLRREGYHITRELNTCR